MTLAFLQIVSCVALAGAAIHWRFRKRVGEGAHRFLFPFIMTAGAMGCVLVAGYCLESFIAYHMGAIHEVEAVKFRLNGPYWWVYWTGGILPVLPVCGILPAVGKRPVILAGIALLAMIPAIYATAMLR